MSDQPDSVPGATLDDDQAQAPDPGPSTARGGALSRKAVVTAVAALVIVLILACALAASLIGSSVKSKPHDVPFGVVGSSSLVSAVGKQVSLKTIQYPSESAVRQAIDQTKIYGALIPANKGDTLIVVPAASFGLQLTLGSAFRETAAKLHTPLVVQQSHPLPPADPVGAVAELMLLPLLIGGYLASVLLTKATGIAMGPGRMATLVGYAFVGALLTDLIAGPLLGAYAGSHFWTLWPIFALITAAVALFAAALLRVLGVWGTLVVFVLFIILGGSSAGGAGIPLLPSFWHSIGPYLPPQNAVVLIRNTLYFDGNGTTHAFVALGVFLLLGVAFGAYFDVFRPQTPPALDPAPSTAAPGSGGSRVSPVVGALVVVAVMQCLFALNYTTADRNPVASNLPFGVVGSSTLVAQVQQHMSLKTIQYPNEAAVHEAFDQAKIYGALVAGSTADILLINASASEYAPYPLATNFAAAAMAQKAPLKAQTLNKPPSGDSGGVIPSIVLIALLISGYVASTALMSVTGTATGPWRVAGLVVFSLVAGLVLDLISGAFAWGWPIHQFWPVWAIMALVILTAALVASVLEKLLGALGTFLTIMVMILFGNPSSGGAVGAPFLPSFWRNLGPFLPPRNGLTAVHNTMYFNGHGMTQAVVILGVYAVVFGAASQFLGSYRTPPMPVDVTPETQLQSASVSVAGTAVV